MEKKYVLGLDLGVASIGWGLLELDEQEIPTKIMDQNVVIFKALDNDKGKLYNVDRRNQRGQRRTIRRRREKIRLVKKLLINEKIINEERLAILFHGKGIHQGDNPYILKIKGLSEGLTKEELARVLIHYVKNRGFRSNRKENAKEEKGKMKEAISDIQTIMKRDNVMVSEAINIFRNEKGYTSLHNKEDQYIYGFEREDIQKEIEALLAIQISQGVITDKFKDEYIRIWSSQRDYSEGPASGPYRIESFEKVFGFCKFREGERRVARAAPSFEIFMMLQKLQNLRYFYLDEMGNKSRMDGEIIRDSLTKEQIQKIYAEVIEGKSNKSLTYSYLKKMIQKENIEFEHMPRASKKEFYAVMKKYKEAHSIDASIVLDDIQYSEVKKLAKKENEKQKVCELKSYVSIKKEIEQQKIELNASENLHLLDDIATILTYAKTDNAIVSTIETHYPEFTENEILITKNINISASGSGNLSLSLIQDLNEHMLEGLTYHKAMEELGYDHALYESKTSFATGFPSVSEIEHAYDTIITQPNVRHVLSMLRKLYKKIVEKHGEPYYVHIEVAREIRNDFTKRMEIKNSQMQNQIANQMAKVELAKEFGTDLLKGRHYGNFSRDDLVKYRLWKDQEGICLYSGEKIELNQLLDRGTCEVDHILPFSRTFDDSFQNKVLVSKHANQDKRNRTPYEWLSKKQDHEWKNFKERVNQNKILTYSKKEKLLLTEEISYEKFSEQSLHATAYISKLAVRIFKDILNVDDDNQRVRSFKGGATSYLRKYYRLNHLTHSLESSTYNRNDTEYYLSDDFKIKIDTKNKEKTMIELNAKNTYGDELTYSLRVNFNKKEDRFFKQEDEALYKILVGQEAKLRDYLDANDFFRVELNAINDERLMRDIAKDDGIPLLVYKLFQGLRAKQSEKNRANHFHHIIDALLVASMTLSMQMKITKFHQLLQQMNHTQQRNTEDEETGEIYTRESLLKEFHIDSEVMKNPKYQLPLPYPEFLEELKYRIFERNEEILREKMNSLNNYSTEEANEATLKYPRFVVDKRVQGALHAETIYGMSDERGKAVATIRKSVKDLKEKDLEKIFDKDGGQKEIYETLKSWMKNKTGHPLLKNGNVIKKVKLKDENIEKLVKISPTDEQKGYAMIGSVARIEIYKQEGSDKLYFVQIPIDAYLKLKDNNLDFQVKIWWGQGNNNQLIRYSDLIKEYTLFQRVYPGQIIEVRQRNGACCICITTGFTSGLFEVSSVLGDGFDLIQSKLFGKARERYQLTVSTIEEIKPIHIDILGNKICLTDK